MANDEDDKRVVCEILRASGLTVEYVAESAIPRCDLCGHDNERNDYLFEIKGLHDAESIVTSLRTGNDCSESLAYDTARAVDAGIRKAVNQLDATAGESAHVLRFLALRIHSKYNSEVILSQILGHLYGKRSLVVASSVLGRTDHFECLYFSHSAFFRYRNGLDGAMIIDSAGAMFFINDHSVRFKGAQDAILCKFFKQHEAFHDAAEFRKRGFLIADCDFDRNQEQMVLQFVAKKYNLIEPRLMEFKRHSSFSTVQARQGGEAD